MAIYKLAVKMILVHNHPCGALEPSKADLTFTDCLIKVGELLKVPVLDHLIISETGFTSLADIGEIEKLRKACTYQIVTREEAELKEWKISMEKDRARKEERKIIARKMKEAGMEKKSSSKLPDWGLIKLEQSSSKNFSFLAGWSGPLCSALKKEKVLHFPDLNELSPPLHFAPGGRFSFNQNKVT